MKATFEFDLDDPHEAKEAARYMKSPYLAIALWDIQQMLRNALKYEGFMGKDKYLTGCQYAVAEKIYDKVNDIIREYELDSVISD